MSKKHMHDVDNGTDIDAIGTNSIRHTWMAYIGGLVPVTFVFIWSILNVAGKLNVITHTWDNLLLSSSMIFIGAVLCALHWRQTNENLPAGGASSTISTIYRSSLVNDLKFYKAIIVAGIAFFCFALATYIEFNEVDGDALYTKGWYISNVTDVANQKVYTTRGTMKLIGGKLTMLVGFIASLMCYFAFFLTGQGGVIAATESGNGIEAGYKGFASVPPKNAATSSLIRHESAARV